MMTDPTKVISGRALAALAFLVAEIRAKTGAVPWDETGITPVLSKATTLPQCVNAAALTIAAVKCALDPSNRTPAVIALAGAHWQERTTDPRDKPAYYGPSAQFCRHEIANEVTGQPQRCGMFLHPGETCTHTTRTMTSEERSYAIAQARQAVADARGSVERAEGEAERKRAEVVA